MADVAVRYPREHVALHAYGVAVVAVGVPMTTVAAVLGPASLNTTAVYAALTGAGACELIARTWCRRSGTRELRLSIGHRSASKSPL